MPAGKSFLEIKDFYKDQIQNKLFPYWTNFIDTQYGGILNCISNDGEKLLSTDKFTWSQGRWLYILSKLYEAGPQVFDKLNFMQIKESMDKTYNFIVNHALFDNYRCCFLLSQTGEKHLDSETGRYDTSIYADCFALIGISQYIKATKDKTKTDIAIKLADSIIQRYKKKNYLTEPYKVTSLYTVHGVPMILENTIHVFREALKTFSIDDLYYFEFEGKMVHLILDNLYDKKNHVIREYVSTDERRTIYLQDRHINPGHTLEDAWFWIEYLKESKQLDAYINQIEDIVQSVFEKGWDKEYGGLLHYVDYEGLEVKGISQKTSYDDNVLTTWDMKLWWAHSEMLYLFLLLYKITNKEIYMTYYNKVFDYTFKTFPSKQNSEWIQIRNKNGSPQEMFVALPVKDPFHILRNFIKITEL